MGEKRKSRLVPIEHLLAKEIEENEARDPQYYYEAKLISIKMSQEMGLADEVIEKAFRIKIRPEDRKN